MPSNIWEIVIVALVLLTLVLVVIAILDLKRTKTQLMHSIGLLDELHKANGQCHSKIAALENQVNVLQHDVQTSVTKAQSSEENVSELATALRQCEDNIDRLFEQDPALKMYAKASKLVAAGEDIEDIIEATGLPRAEVEVLVSVNRK